MQKYLSSFYWAVVIAFLVLTPHLSSLEAANKYSVITIENDTQYRVFYSYRWGEGQQTWNNSIPPNGSYIHWWTFEYDNENWAPWFYVQIDGQNKWFKLSSFFSESTDESTGKRYRFRYDDRQGFVLDEWLYKQ